MIGSMSTGLGAVAAHPVETIAGAAGRQLRVALLEDRRELERLRRVAVEVRDRTPADVCAELIAMAAETPTDDDTVVLCLRLGTPD